MTPVETDSITAPAGPFPAAVAAPSSATSRAERRPAPVHAVSWTLTCLSVDAAMLAVAAAAAQVGANSAGVGRASALWLTVFSLLVLGLMAGRKMYAHRLRLRLLEDLRVVAVATTVAAMTVVTSRELIHDTGAVAGQTVRVWLFALVYVAAGRGALYWSQALARRLGEVGEPTVIVGAGQIGRLTAKRLLDEPELGLKPIGFIDKEPLEDADDLLLRLPVLGASWDLEEVLEQHEVRHVIIAFSTAPHHVLLRLVQRCEELGIAVSFVPRLFEKMTRTVAVEHLGGLPLVTVHPSNPKGLQFRVKYAADRVSAALLLVLFSPLLAAGAIAVLLSLGRPLIYRQRRVGRDGREFDILKLRTMRPAEWGDGLDPGELLVSGNGPGGSEGQDRKTRIGGLLRRTAIDELPQLVNVVRGEMSLVGPRPERPEYVEMFEQYVYRYDERHRVKSGITGWAQVHGLRGNTSLRDRVEWDNYYIENWSLWLDVRILLMTLGAIFKFGENSAS